MDAFIYVLACIALGLLVAIVTSLVLSIAMIVILRLSRCVESIISESERRARMRQ